MKKLSKTQEKQHEELTAKLAETFDELSVAIAKFNEEISRLYGDLQPAVDAYNEAVAAANEFAQEVHFEQEGYYDERSDNWRDGDAGSAYSDWMSEWEVELEPIELDDVPQLDDPSREDDFGNLPTEVSS